MRPAGLDQILAFYLRPQGRIGRSEFALGVLLLWLITLIVLLLLVRFADAAPLLAPLLFVLTLPLTIGMAVLVVKRCHDLGLPGSFMLLMFVPLIGIVWLVALLFIPGNAAPNAYGAPPTFRSD
jgi:uncharacterized membrane protein YhaH (DUF805 family)